MKRIALFIICIALACAPASGQNLLKRLGEKAKNAAEQNIGNKVEKGVNDILNGNIGKGKNGGKGQNGQKQQEEQPVLPQQNRAGQQNQQNQQIQQSQADQADQADQAAPANATGTVAVPQNTAKTAYAKSDFVPGDEIFFDDPVENERPGEFPSRWELVNGNAEIVELNGEQVIELLEPNAQTTVRPLMKEEYYLPEEFTIEFDLWSNWKREDDDETQIDFLVLFDNEQNEYGMAKWEIFNSVPVSPDMNQNGNEEFWAMTSSSEVKTVVRWETFQPLLKGDSWTHYAISFNKRAFKGYINGTRVISVPNMQAPRRVAIQAWGSGENAHVFVKNFRMAQGAVPLYDRLASDGKIVTYAITFDTGKATLKPEADVEINRIKGLLDKDPSLKFEVQGHCDNTGSDKVNDPLSQKRAEAIVARLVEMGIGKDRLTAVGKGSHEPIADNGTDEGRAKNRRVEFIKK